MSSKIAIAVEGVSKEYPLSIEERGVNRFFNSKIPSRHYQALRDVSFEVYRRETVGILGINGAGKSTLLRIISGITKPSAGKVRTFGTLAPIIALQAGFNPRLTGRENIWLKGKLMGLSRGDIEARLDDILRFAHIGDFIDKPLHTYSKGMRARLAFAVAFHTEPDILLVDETLAVGDEVFVRKCIDRIASLKEKGVTILLVTHNLNFLKQFCDRALLLDQGERLLFSEVKTAVEQFHRLVYTPLPERRAIREQIKAMDRGEAPPTLSERDKQPSESTCEALDPTLSSSPRAYVPRGAKILEVSLQNERGEKVNVLPFAACHSIDVGVELLRPASKPRLCVTLKTLEGFEVWGKEYLLGERMVEPGTFKIPFPFRNLLMPGIYFIDVYLLSELESQEIMLHGIQDALAFQVLGDKGTTRGVVDLSLSGPLANFHEGVAHTPDDGR